MLDMIKILSAQILIFRGQESLKEKSDPIEAEADSLFYWVLTITEKYMEESQPAKAHLLVKLIAYQDTDGKWYVREDEENSKAMYRSRYVDENTDFSQVVKKVARIFGKVDGFDIKVFGPDKENTTEMLVYVNF